MRCPLTTAYAPLLEWVNVCINTESVCALIPVDSCTNTKYVHTIPQFCGPGKTIDTYLILLD